MSNIEDTKRLKPTIKVTRELYLKSGNRCAFPGCEEFMITEEGTFVGQICHIEAAQKNGERFNPNMTNEDRRSFENLMLMCYKHHKVTDDVEKYTVEKLKEMKKNHESKFSNILNNIQESIKDYGVSPNSKESINCKKLSETLGFQCNDEENIILSRELNKLIEKMKNLPIETRKVFSIMLSRSYNCDTYKSNVVPLLEIEAVTRLSRSALFTHIDMLERRNLISYCVEDDEYKPIAKILNDPDSGWNYWADILKFCKKTGVSCDHVITTLDFSVFD